jgi:hypothetical protein
MVLYFKCELNTVIHTKITSTPNELQEKKIPLVRSTKIMFWFRARGLIWGFFFHQTPLIANQSFLLVSSSRELELTLIYLLFGKRVASEFWRTFP